MLFRSGVWDFMSINWVVRGTVMLIFFYIHTRRRNESMLPSRWPLAIIAAPVLVCHALAFVLALKLTDSAIVVNILSSFRGLVSVLLIFGLGLIRMGNYERMTVPIVFGRLAGSLLVCLGIYLALGGMDDKGPADVEPPPAITLPVAHPAAIITPVDQPAQPAATPAPAVPSAQLQP